LQIGLSVLELIGLSSFFWRNNGASYRAQHARESESGAGTREALKSKVTWLCAAFFFCYMGVEGTYIFASSGG
jgi:fucose permease